MLVKVGGLVNENFMLLEQSYNEELLVIFGYKELRPSSLDENENSIFSFSSPHS